MLLQIEVVLCLFCKSSVRICRFSLWGFFKINTWVTTFWLHLGSFGWALKYNLGTHNTFARHQTTLEHPLGLVFLPSKHDLFSCLFKALIKVRDVVVKVRTEQPTYSFPPPSSFSCSGSVIPMVCSGCALWSGLNSLNKLSYTSCQRKGTAARYREPSQFAELFTFSRRVRPSHPVEEAQLVLLVSAMSLYLVTSQSL